jgi:anhydro-N-acetylmuramic acid kinase
MIKVSGWNKNVAPTYNGDSSLYAGNIMSQLYMGLMSGTSVDGIDVALVDFSQPQPQLIAFDCQPFPQAIKQQIQHISLPNQPITLQAYGALDCQLGHLFADAVNQLLAQENISPTLIQAIGSHGQTVYHQPHTDLPFSLQIGDPNVIAQKTGITTIADFRRRDIAAGGQGAPLAPAFHQAVFAQQTEKITVLNIGGIANITILFKNQVVAFDIGVGNTLMDYWVNKHLQQAYDKNGDWARSGHVIPALLARLKQADYFAAPPPKSTGKEYFSPAWLENHLTTCPNLKPADVQATLCQLTAETISEAIAQYAIETERLLVCGGGVYNAYLMALLSCGKYAVSSTADYGVRPDAMEAMAFAWLAQQTLNHTTGNLIHVTGANTPVILGGIYPAK